MELYPDRVYSKPEFTALPPYLFSGADFALIPSRDEPFGLVVVEFDRKGALGVGSRLGGLSLMPGWVSELACEIFCCFADCLNSGSLSNLRQQNTCCPSLARQSKRPSSIPQRSVSCSMLVLPSNVSLSSNGVNVPRISTRGVSMLAAGSRDWMPGGSQTEMQVECCQSSMLEIGTRFNK